MQINQERIKSVLKILHAGQSEEVTDAFEDIMLKGTKHPMETFALGTKTVLGFIIDSRKKIPGGLVDMLEDAGMPVAQAVFTQGIVLGALLAMASDNPKLDELINSFTDLKEANKNVHPIGSAKKQ